MRKNVYIIKQSTSRSLRWAQNSLQELHSISCLKPLLQHIWTTCGRATLRDVLLFSLWKSRVFWKFASVHSKLKSNFEISQMSYSLLTMISFNEYLNSLKKLGYLQGNIVWSWFCRHRTNRCSLGVSEAARSVHLPTLVILPALSDVHNAGGRRGKDSGSLLGRCAW